MTIIEQARELLALAECAEGSDGAAWAAGNTLERRAPEAIAALCRALIARDEALQKIAANFGKPLPGDTWQERASALTQRYDECVQVANRALTDDGKHEQQTGQGT